MDSPFLTYSLEDITAMEKFFRRNLINCLSGFKSVNLLGSVSDKGLTNLAVFSQVIHVGATPPLMGVLFRPHSVPRHSLENIFGTKEYTLNHINSGIYQQAHQTSARYQSSEFEAVGLTPFYTDRVSAPYVKEANLKIGLQYREHHTLMNETILVVGEVQEIHLPTESIGEDGFLDLEKTDTVTCSGLDKYHLTETLSRLTYPKPGKPLSSIE
ncbi:MAG: flavin reductase [Cyclobacteriaceae bacterium]